MNWPESVHSPKRIHSLEAINHFRALPPGLGARLGEALNPYPSLHPSLPRAEERFGALESSGTRVAGPRVLRLSQRPHAGNPFHRPRETGAGISGGISVGERRRSRRTVRADGTLTEKTNPIANFKGGNTREGFEPRLPQKSLHTALRP